jgi:hypothetical protein
MKCIIQNSKRDIKSLSRAMYLLELSLLHHIHLYMYM